MFFEKPTCMICDKEIEEDKMVFVQLRYPKSRGFTEIKAYLKSEGKFICENCFNQKSN
ncbi:Fe3+ hydroxamate ABC transporter substrate-binding protein [Paraliobacillus sp. JSM ZJ581]|uniref:Fe3+ hydroxamate ABC transporter substrate-binding protein n=1 Tax=Paraliobacillus sp. JSM ZJ581 TaxID=3342118 RepID=UPI0035A958BD